MAGATDLDGYEFTWSCYVWGPNPEYDRDMAAFTDNYTVPMCAGQRAELLRVVADEGAK